MHEHTSLRWYSRGGGGGDPALAGSEIKYISLLCFDICHSLPLNLTVFFSKMWGEKSGFLTTITLFLLGHNMVEVIVIATKKWHLCALGNAISTASQNRWPQVCMIITVVNGSAPRAEVLVNAGCSIQRPRIMRNTEGTMFASLFTVQTITSRILPHYRPGKTGGVVPGQWNNSYIPGVDPSQMVWRYILMLALCEFLQWFELCTV